MASRGTERSSKAHNGPSICRALLQIAWILMLFQPAWWSIGFVTFAALELLVPAWAERAGATTWHPHHIAERFGLFTIIVLGESIFAATNAVQSALQAGSPLGELAEIVVGGLLIVYSMWWFYFDWPAHAQLTSLRQSFVWGYGHFPIFASAAAVGAGLAVAVDEARAHGHAVWAGAAVAVPVAIFVICLWMLHHRPDRSPLRFTGPIAAVGVLLTPATGYAVLLTGLMLATVIAVKVAVQSRAVAPTDRRLAGS